jgi:nitrogen PTS system EIIA component
MTKISDLAGPDAIVPNLKAATKKQALQELARTAAALTGVPEAVILDVLMKRERLGSTGLGQGVAIPHGKIEGLTRLQGVFARLAAPIDFDAVDDKPVDLIFVLLVPGHAGADHLKALARVSRLLRDQALCEKLRGSDSADAIYALLTEFEEAAFAA